MVRVHVGHRLTCTRAVARLVPINKEGVALSDDKKTEVKSTFPAFAVTMGALTVLFAGAKIFGHLSWSWWLVFAPLWGPPAAVVGLVAVGAVLFGIGFGIYKGIEAIADHMASKREDRKKLRPNVRISKSQD